MTTAPTTAQLPDLRADVVAAQRWVAGLIRAVRPEQLDLPTPDAEWDVRSLLRHLCGVADRLVVMGHGRPADSASALPELPADPYAGFVERVEAGEQAWSDDASLSRLVVAPFGEVPGAAVLAVYLSENLVHGWDLAVATGQDPEADARLVGPASAAMHRVLPAAGRTDVPFADAVEPAAGAGPTEQLAAWLGRARP